MPRFCLLFALLVLTLAFAVVPATAAEKVDRPNILFCFADDWGRYASCYAATESRPSPNQVVKTPNIDRVAARGVLFKNAFVNSPSCTPCRSSLLSGRYFFATGRAAILQGAIWDGSVPSYPSLVADSGYHIGETWKVWSPGTPNDAPFGAGKHAYEKAGRDFNNFSENVSKMVRGGMPQREAEQKLYAEVTGNFEAFLADRKGDGTQKQPFCYWFGPTNVHRAWEKGSGKALWGIDPDSLTGKLPKFLPDVPEIREDFADYLGEIQAYDAAIGLLLKKLEEIGELDRTLIVISGDHGAPGFPHGKCNLYDFGVGVSLVAAWPGGTKGRVVDDFVNLMDLTPTFLEVAGAKPPAGMHGKSLVNVLTSDKSGQVDPERTWVVTGRERHVAGAREENLPYPQRALRNGKFLYIRNFAPDRWPMGSPASEAVDPKGIASDTHLTFADMDASPTKQWLITHRGFAEWKKFYEYAFEKRSEEELYDLERDPDQLVNVAPVPSFQTVRREMSEQLTKILKEAGDPRVTGDGKTFERPPFTDGMPDKKGAKKSAK